MLSYQHEYHAGNFADVHKHLVLWLLLDVLRTRPKPFVVLDLYAGAGDYALDSQAARRTGEWRQGIGRLASAGKVPDPLAPFLRAIRSLQPDSHAGLTRYPGSPRIAQLCLREGDRLIACELHPSAHAALRALLRSDGRCHVHHRDAREAARALFPPEPRRGLVLLDPAYERAAEFDEVAELAAEVRRRWNTGLILIWYPILAEQRHLRLRQSLRAAHAGERMLFSELRLREPVAGPGLLGSGMVVIGAPWQFELRLRQALFAVWKILDPEQRGGLYQALMLENEPGRPHFERVESPEPPAKPDVKDHD